MLIYTLTQPGPIRADRVDEGYPLNRSRPSTWQFLIATLPYLEADRKSEGENRGRGPDRKNTHQALIVFK